MSIGDMANMCTNISFHVDGETSNGLRAKFIIKFISYNFGKYVEEKN